LFFFLIISVRTLGTDSSTACVFVGFGDRLQQSVRSVTCVSLSFPESANRWDRWKEPPTGNGSNLWRGPTVPVLAAGLSQWYGPLVGLNRPSGQSHIPMQWFSLYIYTYMVFITCYKLETSVPVCMFVNTPKITMWHSCECSHVFIRLHEHTNTCWYQYVNIHKNT
jgi:hypothetical protein